MKTIALSFLVLLLSACAATTPGEARKMGPDRQYRFEVAVDYQTAYRRIIEAARSCYQGQVITSTMMVNGDLYPDSRSGTVTVGMYGIASSVYQVIDVRGVDNGHTEITATFPLGLVEKQGVKVKGWTEETGTGC